MHKGRQGFFWSFIDSFAGQGVQFVIGLVLARLLLPADFGLIGMLTIFIAISQSFVDSGFGSALIRKKHCSDADYSTVFYFNLVVSCLAFSMLFIAAPFISKFFQEPRLTILLRVLAIGLILNAGGLIQRTIFTKQVNFKVQTQVSLIAALSSGIVSITMAFLGFEVWSLVALTLTRYGVNTVTIWFKSSWRPLWLFSIKSFKELFGFGSKLLISGLINTGYKNIYYLIIGKYFSASDLGFYTKADEFKKLPSENLNSVIGRVSYPLLANLQDNPEALKAGYVKIIKTSMFLSFLFMLGLAAVSRDLLLVLIGEAWLPAVPYLQLMCFVGMLYPLHALNLNMLQVQGRSDLFLKLEIIKKFMALPIIALGIWKGIEVMIIGMFFNSCVAFFLNAYWSGRKINYGWKEQLGDIYPSLLFSIAVSFPTYMISTELFNNAGKTLGFQFLLAGALILILGEMKLSREYTILKAELFALLRTKK
ncbi:MAG: lipopolysaccharide biosynthesis protein [Bacteroidia bacterium]